MEKSDLKLRLGIISKNTLIILTNDFTITFNLLRNNKYNDSLGNINFISSDDKKIIASSIKDFFDTENYNMLVLNYDIVLDLLSDEKLKSLMKLAINKNKYLFLISQVTPKESIKGNEYCEVIKESVLKKRLNSDGVVSIIKSVFENIKI